MPQDFELYADYKEWPNEKLLLRYGGLLDTKPLRWYMDEVIQNLHAEILRRMKEGNPDGS